MVFGLTITFLKQFGIGLWLTIPLLLSLAAAITLLGKLWEERKDGRALTASIGRSFRDHGWIWRYSTSQTRIKDSCDLDCLPGASLTGIVIAVAVRAGSLALGTPGS